MKAFTVVDVPQRSPEWVAARLGRLCGSKASDMLTSTKSGGEAAGRRNLRVALVLERITGRSMDSPYLSAAMTQGIEREEAAYAAYEALTGELLTRTGFLSHTTHAAGCSLDGHAGDFERIIEIKSPLPATHLDYLTTGRVPADYRKQVVHSLWISGAASCDWLSYNPDFPPELQIKLVRIERDEAEIAAYELAALAFLREVDAAVEAVKKLRPA